SHLYSNVLVYGNEQASKLEVLYKLQKKFLRSLYNLDYRAHTGSLFIMSGIIPIHKLYQLKMLYIFTREKYRTYRSLIEKLAELQIRDYQVNTRVLNHEKYIIPTVRKQYLEKSLSFSVPKILNRISTPFKSVIEIENYVPN